MSLKAKLIAVAATALVVGAVSAADATVYNVNRTIGIGGVTGTIETDGTTGTLSPSNFIAWDLQLIGDGATTEIKNTDGNAAVWGAGTDVTADAQNVYFNFSAADSGFLVFQDGQGSGNFYWCLNSTNGGCLNSESVVPQNYQDASAQFAALTGNQIVATAAGTVPEPATWALMLMGFAGLAYAGFRQGRGRMLASG